MVVVSSLSELAEGGNNTVDGVLRVGERRRVAGSPRELSGQASSNTLFGVAVGGKVTDFLLHGLEHLGAIAELLHLKHGHLVDISDVPHHLELLEMSRVVGHVQREIILHCDIKCLHFLGLATDSAHGGIHRVLGCHEAVVLGSDLVNDAGGVDHGLVGVPVDVLAPGGGLGQIVEVEDGTEL
jgi:hypothetical protein